MLLEVLMLDILNPEMLAFHSKISGWLNRVKSQGEERATVWTCFGAASLPRASWPLPRLAGQSSLSIRHCEESAQPPGVTVWGAAHRDPHLEVCNWHSGVLLAGVSISRLQVMASVYVKMEHPHLQHTCTHLQECAVLQATKVNDTSKIRFFFTCHIKIVE